MRTLRLLPVFLVLAAVGSHAQTIPAQGEAQTFEVASWNLKWFGNTSQGPTNETLQRQNIAAVVRGADIDVWAMQEVANPTAWVTLLGDLQAEGLQGTLGPPVSSDPSFDQRLGYIYDPAAVTVIATRALPGSVVTAYNFGGRAPLEMLASVTTNGANRSIRIINLHAKASTGIDDYNRRLAGSVELKQYTDELVAQGVAVIVLGDLNDRLNMSTVSGQLSPYRNFSLDTDDYDFATRGLDQTNTPTFCSNNTCSSGSPIDHVFFSSQLFADYVADSGDRFIELTTAIPSYRSTTSDHLPVFAKFALPNVANEEEPAGDGPLVLRSAVPNPFGSNTAIRFHLDAPAGVRVDVIDALGRTVFTSESGFGAGEQRVLLDGQRLPAGVYVVRIASEGRTHSQRIIRTN